ncbi:MAG: hypothetical protein IT207_10375 [Fimbriimonadaceae bacterium]|nr:hypothetical protein [Fimbriimonadaceae bacterium]
MTATAVMLVCGCSQPVAEIAVPNGSAASAVPALDAKHALSQERTARAMAGLEVRGGLLLVVRPIQATPAQAQALLAQARASLVENSWFVCCEAYGKALRAAPGSAEAYEGFAQAAMTDVKTDLAEVALRSALKFEPSRLSARFKLGELRQMAGDYAGAREEWAQVAAASPRFRDVEARLATVAYFDGDAPSARRHLAKAKALGQSVPPQFEALLTSQTEGRP